MAERIYVMKEGGSLEPLTERQFAAEEVLQRLIAEHPELLDGEQIRPSDPRRWLLMTREMGIADAPDAGDRWSVDHLLVDQDAVPTFVEVKRSANPEIRRSVVGQMLDYAAHATVTLGAEAIRRSFESRHGEDAGNVLLKFLAPDADADPEVLLGAFWERLATNLEAKRLRLLFVADQIPDELARVVEFLNEQMPRIEVLAVEIKQFRGETLRTLVPQVIGRTAAKNPTPDRPPPLTRERFYDLLPDRAAAKATRELIAAAEERGAIVDPGTTGLMVKVQSTIRKPPLTVAWLFPTMQSYWFGLKGFTIGQVNWVDLPPGMQAAFDHLYEQLSRDGFAEEVGNKEGGSRGWAIDPAVVATHVDVVKERLARAIAILQSA